MQLLTQRQLHNPEAGIQGDSLRTCLAMLLDMRVEQFHVFDGPYALETARRILNSINLKDIHVPLKQIRRGTKYLIATKGLYTPDHYHWLIGEGRKVLYDPHPARKGMKEPLPDVETLYYELIRNQ